MLVQEGVEHEHVAELDERLVEVRPVLGQVLPVLVPVRRDLRLRPHVELEHVVAEPLHGNGN